MVLLARNAAGRPTGQIVGSDTGSWEYHEEYELGAIKYYDWVANIGLSRNTISVDNATEYNVGFTYALKEAAQSYPELLQMEVQFDGPKLRVFDVLNSASQKFDWYNIPLYHGTSTTFLDDILINGLITRGNRKSSYGTEFGAREGRSDAVYLTSQIGMARSAAFSARRQHKGEPVIIEVDIASLDISRFAPDEDSKEKSPEVSMMRIGSVAYVGDIPPEAIKSYGILK